jgi:hypothetical protein
LIIPETIKINAQDFVKQAIKITGQLSNNNNKLMILTHGKLFVGTIEKGCSKLRMI